jgi:hypothetical protein
MKICGSPFKVRLSILICPDWVNSAGLCAKATEQARLRAAGIRQSAFIICPLIPLF